MEIIMLKLSEIRPYENNPRRNDDAVQYVANSIKQFGFRVPIVVDKNNVIVCGHTRFKASKKLGISEVPCVRADDLSDEQIKAYRLVDNKVSEKAEWDDELLNLELDKIYDIDMTDFNFDVVSDAIEYNGEYQNKSLIERYVVPPFSVLDASQGYWQKRKKEWFQIIHSGDGRDTGLLGKGLEILAKKNNKNSCLTGTSIFDPVLAETLLAWFCPSHGRVIDPFAGGSVRGLVCSFTGRDYVGMDLSQRQINENEKNYNEVKNMNDFNGEKLKHPKWICGDSMTIDDVVNGEFDFMLTCPPYADLEKYSDDPRDISNMEYPKFIKCYREIIKKSTNLLKDNAYVAIVVGEVRGKKGEYLNFVPDTIRAFEDVGLRYYNECILKTMGGTIALRANRTFQKLRKVCKTHQNVLIFIKGNEKEIKLGDYDYEFPSSAEEEIV